jgi:outer membrane lipoprotein-sorting protein
MQRRSLVLALSAWFVVSGALAAGAQTVDEIVAKNVEAKGGAAKIRAVQTMKQTARMTGTGMELTITIYSKRPNLMRQELTGGGMTMVMAFDGTMAWGMNPAMGPTPAPLSGPDADMAKEQADLDGPLIDYKTKGNQIELVGTETLAERKVHHLKITTPSKRVIHCYLDAETGLEAKIVADGPMGSIEQELSDYRDIEGIKMPFTIRSSVAGQRVQIAIDKVEINPVIDPAVFKMPRGN